MDVGAGTHTGAVLTSLEGADWSSDLNTHHDVVDVAIPVLLHS